MKKGIACLLVLTMVPSCLTACTMYVPQSAGSIMTGEACADMAGIKVMLRLAAENPDFDYDKFFRSYAKVWLLKACILLRRTGLRSGERYAAEPQGMILNTVAATP